MFDKYNKYRDRYESRYRHEHQELKPNTAIQIKLKGKLINAKTLTTSISGKVNASANGKKYFCQLDMNEWKVRNEI